MYINYNNYIAHIKLFCFSLYLLYIEKIYI